MAVYLLHFMEPYKHARHYLGYAGVVATRLKQHENGTGARLTQVVIEHGGSWVLARVWNDGDRALERQLKGRHSGVRLCPICQGRGQEDV
jgi:predicted GIY-YIG superfamily endonuclease